MLKSWSIKNFKPIVDSGELQLAPVTVLAGRNSSGKSSLLQSILMIAQTLGSRLLDRPLLPNERLVQLGTFENVLSDFTDSLVMEIAFKMVWNEEDRIDAVEETELLTLGIDEMSREASIIVSFQSAKRRSRTSLTTNTSNIVINQARIKARAFSPISVYPHKQVLEEGQLDFHLSNISAGEINQIAAVFHPLRYIGTFISADKKMKREAFLQLSHFLPINFLSRPISETQKTISDSPDDRVWNTLIYGSVLQTIYFFTHAIRYLGPSRVDPGVVQQQFAPTSELDDVGIKGEYAAFVYHTSKNSLIDWYNPQTRQVENSTLQVALDSWIRYLKIAECVRTAEAGGIGITWQIVPRPGMKPRALPEVGTGVGKLLPVLVMGLLAPTNTLLIIEEPELDLHPYAQARLGDFFMGLAKCKKQCLIETHSENLVSQLRLHIVEAGGLEKSDCMVYFVDQDERGAAKFNKIEISPNGNILNWPDGFFDETMLQEDRITAASLRKRAQRAKHGS